MRRNSREAYREAQYLDRSRINVVQAASKLLQHALDIATGTRFLHDVAVNTWRLPQAPEQPRRRSNFATPHAAFEDLMALTLRDATQPAGAISKSIEHSESEAAPLLSLLSTNHDKPASPPCNYSSPLPSDEEILLPPYWDPHLSTSLYTWLEDPATLSSQIELTYLDLQGPEGSLPDLRYSAKEGEKIKLTHILLPGMGGSSSEKEWIIIGVQNLHLEAEVMNLSDSPSVEDTEPSQPYWLLAFPVSAVTASQSITSPDGAQQMTSLTFGDTHHIPSIHGRSVPRRFAQKFMAACASGLGVVEMGSSRVALSQQQSNEEH